MAEGLQEDTSPATTRRVIMRLGNPSLGTLMEPDVLGLNDKLRGHQRRSDKHHISFLDGSYFVDLDSKAELEKTSIEEAVGRTTTAMAEVGLFTDIEQVWLVEPGLPRIEKLASDDRATLRDVSDVGLQVYAQRREQALTHMFGMLEMLATA